MAPTPQRTAIVAGAPPRRRPGHRAAAGCRRWLLPLPGLVVDTPLWERAGVRVDQHPALHAWVTDEASSTGVRRPQVSA